MPFNKWKSIDQGGDIPYHRIAQFKYNNFILWDRKQKIDNINNNSGETTVDFHTIKQSINQNVSIHTNNEETSNSNTNPTISENINNYQDPMDASEYIADSQFLGLLKMEPKNVLSLYDVLNEMMDNAFILQRPNSVEVLARHLCYKYLSYIHTMTRNTYYLFGSTKIALNTYKSDLDIKVIPNGNKISTRDECIFMLNTIKNEILDLQPLQYILKQRKSTENPTSHRFINLQDFKNDENNEQMIELHHNIIQEEIIDRIALNVSSIQIADGIIPRCIVVFKINIHSKQLMIKEFNISMDITIRVDITGHEQLRDKHLSNWVHKYCINNEDKRIHKYLFCIKLWAQQFKINSSIMSTINGYGWIHIAMFLLTLHYKQKHGIDYKPNNTDNDENKENAYESIYSDIDLPKEVNCAKLFILFIDMLHSWICYDETTVNDPQNMTRLGMNVITGKWIQNQKGYTLFVLDPFCQSNNLPDNLAKCVRHRKGVPLLMNAIKSTIQQLQFAADESVKHNDDSISKHIQFFQHKHREIQINTARICDEIKQQNVDNVLNNDEEHVQDIIQYFTWKQLCNLNLNIPKRNWKQQTSHTTDDTIIICQFNCLAQALTAGNTERTTFRADSKYLKWEHRSVRILYEILQYKPDIICLCEVDAIYFHNFYYPNLSKSAFKYDGIYLNKNNPNKHKISNSNKKSRSPRDGLAIFWNASKFSCYDKYECILGKPNKAYHVALGVRLKYRNKDKLSNDFDVWCTHLKAGRNNKSEKWRLSQVNTLLYYMRKYSYKVPILFCGDLNAHFDALHNNYGELVEAKVYPALLNGVIKSKYNKKSSKSNKNNDFSIQFQSVWNNNTRNKWSTWAGWMDRDVKCCLDYIMIGDWMKHSTNNDDNQSKITNTSATFKVTQILDIWDDKEVQKFDCKLPNKIYPSDHILIAAKIAIETN